ncbi:MAG: CapA family protein [bacterium]
MHRPFGFYPSLIGISAVLLLIQLSLFPTFNPVSAIDFTQGEAVENSTLSIAENNITLSLPRPLDGTELYLLFYGPNPSFNFSESTLLGATQRDFYVDPFLFNQSEKVFYKALKFPDGIAWVMDEIMIEDFEDGTVTLESYPGQDEQPNAWEVTSLYTADSSLFSLTIYGNSWKIQSISAIVMAPGTVWRASVMSYDEGEFQAIGFGDGTNELFYVFDGDYLPEGAEWNTVFHSIAPEGEWGLLNMPIANDWYIRYDEFPTIDRIFYVNDIDAGGQTSISFWDEIHDITDDLSNIPEVYITANGDSSALQPTYTFTSTVFDPDSPTHTYHWDFGDGTTSDEPNPAHTYDFQGYRTVGLTVMDGDSLFGDACIHLQPPPGTPLPEFTLADAGDVMMARRYEEAGGIIPTEGVNAIFERIKPYFDDMVDYSMFNLECPLTDQGYPHPSKEFYFRGSPENVSGLQYVGVDYVALGNNHTTDYMEPGLMQTQAVVDSVGIIFSGSGLNEYWATRPAFFTVNGIRVAVLSYCNRDGREDFLPPFLEAGYNKAGFAMFDEPTLEATIPLADSLADLVIVQAHVGTEYDFSPLDYPEMQTLAKEEYERFDNTRIDSIDRYLEHRAIELGADVLFAHHPHVLRGFELYQDKLICHSFGNFAFDQNYWETYFSMILYCKVTLDGFSEFTFRPVYIDDYKPTPASGELAERIGRLLTSLSAELDTDVSYDSTTGIGKIATGDWQSHESDRQVTRSITFKEEGNYWVSEPIRMEDPGSISAIESVSGIPGGSQIWLSIGREHLLHGGFEYEGGWLWNIGNDDVFMETMNPHSGTYCLGVRRHENQYYTYSNLEDRIPVNENSRYTIDGYLYGTNCRSAKFGVEFHNYRFSGGSLASEYVSDFNGDLPWTRAYKNIESPDNGWYLDFRCRNSAPDNGTGTAWFDDLILVEWLNDWSQISTGYTAIPYPSEADYFQIRCEDEVQTATVIYQMTERDIY